MFETLAIIMSLVFLRLIKYCGRKGVFFDVVFRGAYLLNGGLHFNPCKLFGHILGVFFASLVRTGYFLALIELKKRKLMNETGITFKVIAFPFF